MIRGVIPVLAILAAYGWLVAWYLCGLLRIAQREAKINGAAYHRAMDGWTKCNADWAAIAKGAVQDVTDRYRAWASVALKALQAAAQKPKDPTIH